MFENALRNGLRFHCTGCSDCCTGAPGYVWLSDVDIDALRMYFGGISIEEFACTYCRYVDVEDGKALSLKEKAHYDCIFLENGRCSVYEARPIQCRTYPFWEEILQTGETWSDESRYCPGIGKGLFVSSEKIADAVVLRRSHPRALYPRPEKQW